MSNIKREELERLGDKIDPKLAEILSKIDSAAKLVEKDDTSYRHMPDYFSARGELVEYIDQYTQGKVDEAEQSYLQSVLRSRAKTNPDITIKELYEGLYEQKHDYRSAQLADINNISKARGDTPEWT